MARLTREIRSGAPAGVLLMVVGGYALMGLPLGLLGAILAGQARDLLTPRGLLILAFPAVGIACLAVGQHVLRGSRRALWAGLGLAVLLVVAGLAFLASYPWTTDTGDGAAYAFLGGITWLGMNGFILLSAMLA
jgi:hypothetical protein